MTNISHRKMKLSKFNPFIDLESIKELADFDLQKQMIDGQIPGRFFDFDDWFPRIFEDTSLDTCLEEGTVIHSEEFTESLKLLFKLCVDFNSERPAIDLFQDPQMEGIRTLARKIIFLSKDIDMRYTGSIHNDN